MIFRQSAVAGLDRDCVVERDPRMPRDIHPALLGTGQVALALDATGMQGLNSQLGQYRDCTVFEAGDFYMEKNLHLFRAQALSQHYNQIPDEPSQSRNFANLPCGWLDYELRIDERVFDAEALLAEARDWERHFRPRDGILETAFSVRSVRVKWTVGMRLGSTEAAFGFVAESLDGRPHQVGLTLRCRFTLRDGRPLFRGGMSVIANEDGLIASRWEGTDATSTARLKQPINLSYAWFCDQPAQGRLEDEALVMEWRGKGERMAADFLLFTGSDREGSDTVGSVRERWTAWRKNAAAAGLEAVRQSWQSWFAGMADFGVGSPEKEFLNAINQYVLRAGLSWSSGLPLGTMWTRKFGSATFWDSFFACDGMLCAGHLDEVRAFCEHLTDIVWENRRNYFIINWLRLFFLLFVASNLL